MACATLKRSLDFDPVHNGRQTKRQRCSPLQCVSPKPSTSSSNVEEPVKTPSIFEQGTPALRTGTQNFFPHYYNSYDRIRLHEHALFNVAHSKFRSHCNELNAINSWSLLVFQVNFKTFATNLSVTGT
jgi:hypothetical protein